MENTQTSITGKAVVTKSITIMNQYLRKNAVENSTKIG
jgi:hypothetical protein